MRQPGRSASGPGGCQRLPCPTSLSNSPDAATDFFSASFLSKDEDHEFKTKDKHGNDVKDALSNFDYLFEECHWPQERNSEGEDSIEGRNNLALALEAATTGHRAGEMPTADTGPHSKEQADLMAAIVQSVHEDPGRLTKHSYMSDSMGQIASEYLPDINRAMADDPRGNTDLLFPLAGAQAEFDHQQITRFLVTVGQHPEGHAAVEAGQQAYTASLMAHHMNPDLSADQRYPQSPADTVQEIARRSAEVSGTLAIGMQEEVVGKASQKNA